jgi:hypothetical protein
MGKAIEYPKASFKASQEMAAAVDSLGGSCSVEMCAEKMGNKVSGAFQNIVYSAQKFRLVNYKAGQISTSSLFRDIKLSYTDDEKTKLLITSFLSPPVFSRLYDRFKGIELPIAMLEKMLIKEYEVDDNVASRIKKYFVEGAKIIGLLNAQNQLIKIEHLSKVNDEDSNLNEEVINQEPIPQAAQESNQNPLSISDLDEFVFHITGPGINSKIAIREEEDFTILEAMIKKIRKRFDFRI